MSKLIQIGGVGLLTNTSKMPCKSFGFSPDNCITGAKLAKIPGTICSECYAMKGNYCFKNVKNAHKVRFEEMKKDFQAFEDLMVEAINNENNKYFRWHDSGDIQSVEHLIIIFNVCHRTPKVKHWIPTREYKIIRQAIRAGLVFPKNLIIRVSATSIDGPLPQGFEHTSSVHKNSAAHGIECKAYTRNGECGNCRKCWDFNVKNVSYPVH